MRAAVLTPDLEFEFEQRERPTPGPGEVLVAIRRVGICGSDVHYYERGRIGDYVVESPLVLGHESAGEVVNVGEGVTEHAPGDRVALEPGVPCGRCARCKRGEYNLCPDVTFMATPPDDGAFAEYVTWPAEFVYGLPDPVSLAAGALCEPLSVGVHAARRGSVGVGDSVLITGAGPIGLLAMEAVRAAGATDVYVSDVVESKLGIARERGADRAIRAAEADVAAAVRAATGGEGVDVAIEASGADAAIRSTVAAVRRGGTVVLVGLSGDDEIPLRTNEIIDGELDVHGSFRYRNSYPEAIDLLAGDSGDREASEDASGSRGPSRDAAGIVDFEAPLGEISAAFERARDPETVKGMIALDG